MSKTILCVTEGEKAEIKIISHLKDQFISNDQIKFISFGTSIYQLYRKISQFEDEFVDTFPILQEISQNGKQEDVLSNYHRNDIAEIYLFFDLDMHDNLAKDNPDCFTRMLQLFDNETENGKLYISYPMVEAFKHPVSQDELFNISQGKNYKHHVAQICNKALENYYRLPKDTLSYHLIEHIKAANYLINENFSYTIDYQSDFCEKFTQSIIYRHQFNKFIQPKNQVLVLSPFALFLVDYLGESLFNEWKSHQNS